MASKKKSKSPPPEPQPFFERVVPRVLGIMRAVCVDMGGRYAVTVDGASWTIDFPTQTVSAGNTGADVAVSLTRAQFEKLSTGKAELAKWVADGEAACVGDRARLENLSMVLAFLERG